MGKVVRAGAVASMVLLWPGMAGAQVPSVYGLWLIESKSAHIELAPCADAGRGPLCGQIRHLIDIRDAEGKPVKPEDAIDARNADPKLRARKVLGMVMLYDFKPGSESNSFSEGTIYSGEDGKTYRANVKLQPDGTLLLRGYVGTPLFGKSQVWTRLR